MKMKSFDRRRYTGYIKKHSCYGSNELYITVAVCRNAFLRQSSSSVSSTHRRTPFLLVLP